VQIIPVVDVREGVVVRAVAGNRSAYRPIQSPLAYSSAPADVAAGLAGLYPFSTLYVADLDGIEGRGADLTLPWRLREASTSSNMTTRNNITIWVDNGAAHVNDVSAMLGDDHVVVVLGSEAGWTVDALQDLPNAIRARVVLSLDFRGDGFVGDHSLLDHPEVWPNRVIAMTLAAVGGDSGPDLSRLAEIRSAAPTANVFAAGGVRNLADLQSLADMGISGALVASALHAGTITASDLTKIAGR